VRAEKDAGCSFPGIANLLIGDLNDAIRENGVPGSHYLKLNFADNSLRL
jgi:hypothetical protein